MLSFRIAMARAAVSEARNTGLFIIPVAGIGAGGMPVGRSHATRNKIITGCIITKMPTAFYRTTVL